MAGKAFLTRMRKYETYLQVIRGEVTMAVLATTVGVDLTKVVRIRQVAKASALSALAASRLASRSSLRQVVIDELAAVVRVP